MAIGVLDGDEVITLAAANSPSRASSRWRSRSASGSRRTGRRSAARPARSPPGADDKDARQIRADGYVVTDGCSRPGCARSPSAIRDHTGEVVASLSVAVNAVRVPISQFEQEFLPVMQDGAATIGALI